MRTCSVEGCDRKHRSNGYCSKHYQQYRLFGKIKERTQNDPNEFIIENDICWVILYDKNCDEVARAKFLAIYYEQIRDSELKWHLTNYGYVGTFWIDEIGNRQQGFLHQAIIQLSGKEIPDGYEIDHKDRNKLNNLDDNLRFCTYAQNNQNRGKQTNNKSGHIGVHWSKQAKKWVAQIRNKGNKEFLGYFDTAEDAARAYNIAAVKYRGEFAILNEV